MSSDYKNDLLNMKIAATSGHWRHTLCEYSRVPGMSDEDDRLKQEVGRRIATARKSLGWTQRELAQRVGMPPSTLANYEQGTRLPGPREATLLGEALGVSPAHLLVVDGDEMQLLDAEAELVRLIRQLPPEEQAKVRKLLEGRARLFAQRTPIKKRPPPK